MSAKQTISIVVLTWNRKKLLRDCLHSLLKQRYERDKLEIVVSDDGSSDGTRELVHRFQKEDPRIKYVCQPHKGISAARNQGICHASGEIIAIVADDYILDASYAETISEFFHQHHQAMTVRFRVIAAGNDLGSRISHLYFDASLRRRLSTIAKDPLRNCKDYGVHVWRKMPSLPEKITTDHDLEASGAAAFRREVFARVGLFDESLQRAEDSDLTMRLRDAGIQVYYYPFHEIMHQYSPFMLDTISKCFQTGVNRCKFCRKHGLWPAKGERIFKRMLLHKLGILVDALQRARQAETTLKLLLYLPFMLVFEAASKFGFVYGLVRARSCSVRSASAIARTSTRQG
jgi:glycosyltransferase involved in cell wall biosynthesis